MEELLLGLDYEILQKGKTEIEFKGMEYDSRKIKDGDIFVALEGSISDGHKYIKQAIENGAKGILVSKKVEPEFPVEYILVKDLRKNLGKIASNFYGYPQKKLCRIWMYRGAWAEWEIENIEMAVPISPEELRAKRNSILKHQSQMESAPFLGNDERQFWQRSEDRNRGTAALYDNLGLASYEAMEAFVEYIPL